MSGPSASTPEYYFVPLGRERGGYLDILGLPPDATEDEAGAKEGDYRLDLDKRFKTARKAIREKVKKGELTEQEFEKQSKVLEEELKNRPLMALGELKSKFDAIQAERRGGENEGRGADPSGAVWMEMYRWFGDRREECWQFLTKPRPVANVAPGLMSAVASRWLDFLRPPAPEPAGPPVALPSARAGTGTPDLAELLALVEERNLVQLLAADLFWARVRFTNRKFWRKQVAAWLTDRAGRGPSFRTEADGPVPTPAQVAYPALCRPTKLAIDRLEAEPADDIAQQPDRTRTARFRCRRSPTSWRWRGSRARAAHPATTNSWPCSPNSRASPDEPAAHRRTSNSFPLQEDRRE